MLCYKINVTSTSTSYTQMRTFLQQGLPLECIKKPPHPPNFNKGHVLNFWWVGVVGGRVNILVNYVETTVVRQEDFLYPKFSFP